MTAKVLGGFLAIPLEELHPSPNNVRSRLTDIDDLAASLREQGPLQPMVVQQIPGRPGYQIVAGHRRRAAALRAGLTHYPCILRRDMLPDEELLAMLVENGQRSDLDPIEEARAYKKLVDSGVSVADVARRVGRGLATVKNRLMLLQLPLVEQEQVRAGHYSLQHAEGMVRAARAEARRAASPVARPIGRPKGAKTKPYFGDTHTLAGAARGLCDHTGTPKVAGVACGPCWEEVIRRDERHCQAVAS